MRTELWIYDGPSGSAAKYLLTHSALAWVTETTETVYAGQNAQHVTMTTPMPSRGEALLWKCLDALSRPFDANLMPVSECAAVLDAENRTALAVAIAAALAPELTATLATAATS